METGTISVATKPTTSDIALAERKKKEQQEQEKEEERRRIKAKAEELAPEYLRIGGVWKKKCIHPITGLPILERISGHDLIEDYGKELGAAIMAEPQNISTR